MLTISALALAFALAADPTTTAAEPVKPAPPPQAWTPAPADPAPSAPAAAVKKGNYLKLAAPSFAGVNLDDKVAGFFTEHFAGALVQRGVQVVTPSEINALIGLERSKQLAGCSEDASSCLAELSNALGVDGLIAGQVAKFGGTVQATIKILRARDGSTLKVLSLKAGSEEQLLETLSAQAKEVAPELLAATGKERAPTAIVEPERTFPMNAFTVNPVLIAGGLYAVEYARVLSPSLVVFIEPRLTRVHGAAGALRLRAENLGGAAVERFDDDGFQVTLGARYYWPGPARGFFAAPQMELGSGVEKLYLRDGTTDDRNRGTLLSAGLMVGHTWMIYEVVPLTIGVGGAWGFLEYSHGLRLIGQLNAGYAF